MSRRLPVLIVHNRPVEGCRWKESDEGVLAEVAAVRAACDRAGQPAQVAGITSIGELSARLEGGGWRAVFNLVEELDGGPYDAALVPLLCEQYGIGCTGSDTRSLMLAQDKWRARAALRGAGLPVPAGVLVRPGERVAAASLPPGALIVKPVRCDASEGIDADAVVPGAGMKLDRAVERVHRDFEQPALIETLFGRREINVALLEAGGRVRALPPAEIDLSRLEPGRPPIVDYAAKWRSDSHAYHNTPRIIPAPLSAQEQDDVLDMALRAWRALGCRDYARVDFRLDEEGGLAILEVNPNPDIAPDAGFQAALAAAGISFDEFVANMLSNAVSRQSGGPARAADEARPEDNGLLIRPMRATDAAPVRQFLEGTGRFHMGELCVAEEVIAAALNHPDTSGYNSLVAEADGDPVGWVCYGAAPCAKGTWDIYWLAVAESCQGRGIGSRLVGEAERGIRSAGGRLVIVETSGRADYLPTRLFYWRRGYVESARVPDFYALGDDKVIFTRALA